MSFSVMIVVIVFLVRRRAKLYKLDYEQKQRENQELYYTPKELAAVRDREAIENKQNQSQTTDKRKVRSRQLFPRLILCFVDYREDRIKSRRKI